MKTIFARFYCAERLARMTGRRCLGIGAILALAAGALSAADFSSGNYRIPYINGAKVTVRQDHQTHVPPNQIDLRSDVTNGNQVVAAASGTVRFIVDNNTVSCVTNGCSALNNYVWIEHANGEWTKYTHIATGSATAAGLTVGMNVAAGTIIGVEGNIGAASGTHLHFEVGVPDDPSDPIVPAGGFLKGVNRIPVICGITGNLFVKGQSYLARDCDAPPISRGVYRIPYANGTQVYVSQDHLTHGPSPTRYDLVGTAGTGPYKVVAAAAGIIRAIVDTNTITGGSSNNNYVWIEHPNGEWTKYTHMQTGTVSSPPPKGAGLSVGQPICAGTYLGDEDDVGAASRIHLHFEVAVPTDLANPFNPSGGFVNGYNLIPVMCGVPGSIMVQGMTLVADVCSSDDCARAVNLAPEIIWGQRVIQAAGEIDSNNSNYLVDTFASVAFRAGQKVTLRPGFRARYESFFHAAIRNCNQTDNLPGCNLTILP